MYLQCKAAGYTELMTECLEYAADLNDTQPLPGFPSAMALRAENQKHFAKVSTLRKSVRWVQLNKQRCQRLDGREIEINRMGNIYE